MSGGKGELGLLFFFLFLVVFFHSRFEVPDTFPEALAERRKLAGAEQEQRNREDEEDLGETNSAFHDETLLGRALLAGSSLAA